jgi:TolB-like protein/DNA-binding winged helix-turn-helix (wHTH) protein/Tfp pilus assembly protein PilF
MHGLHPAHSIGAILVALYCDLVPMQAVVQVFLRARFGVFELELRTGELRRLGTLLHLSPQPSKVLALLVNHAGQLVSREDFRQQIWGSETFVDFEHGLNFAIKKIRDTLGDDASAPRYIETLPRRGYRFIAPVEWLGSTDPPPANGVTVPSAAATSAADHELPQEPAPPLPARLLRRRFPRLWLPALGGLVLVASLFALIVPGVWDRLATALHLHFPQNPPRISSIAVLPLENLSSDPQQEYFADGLTDTLITDLGQVGTMRVISRASVIQYKRGKTTMPQIAHDLNVDAVVEGTVFRSGTKVRISIQLLDARNDRHLWARTYERDLQDIITLEGEVALAIAHEISGRLNTEQEMRLSSTASVNPQAFDAYLRGSYLLAERTPEAETDARGYFEQAVRADPNFAPAYSGLANFYSVAWGLKPDLPLGEQYARKAIALDPDLADGHASLGFIQLIQHKYPEAKPQLQLAIALNPNYALAHNLYADYWLFMGRPTEALAENGKALQLDPFSFPYNFTRCAIFDYLGEYDAALEKLQTVATLNSRDAGVNTMYVHIYWADARVPQALAVEKKIASSMESPQLLRDVDTVAATYSRQGARAALRKEVELRLNARAKLLLSGAKLPELYSSQTMAFLYADLSDRENTLRWLSQAVQEGDGRLDVLGHLFEDVMCSRQFDFLRSDPRFQAIQRRLGLPV